MENIPFRCLNDAGKGTMDFEGDLARVTPVRLDGSQSNMDRLKGLLTSHACQHIYEGIRHVSRDRIHQVH